MKRARFVLLASLLLSPRITPAQQAPGPVWEFKVDDAWGRDTVQFLTAAPLEDIIGTTNQIKGILRANPKNLKAPSTAVRLEVTLASIKTGIEMRDTAVAKALGAEQTPRSTFTLDRVLT